MKPAYKDKICEICGKEFTPKSGKTKYCNQPVTRICIVCGASFQSTCHPRANNVCDKPACKKRAGFVASTSMETKICRVCGQAFKPASSRQVDCGKPLEKICEICGKTYSSKCGLRWKEHTCNDPQCRAQYAHKQQTAHFLSTVRKCVWCGKEFNPLTYPSAKANGIHKKFATGALFL